MKVHQAMTHDVCIASPELTIREAAKLMADVDTGALPVGENDRLVGMITDRDIAIRAVGEGLSPDTKVRDVMSSEVLYCFEDQELEDIAHSMSYLQVRRLPVMNRDKRLTGIVSLSDLAHNERPSTGGQALAGVSTHGGQHCQTLH